MPPRRRSDYPIVAAKTSPRATRPRTTPSTSRANRRCERLDPTQATPVDRCAPEGRDRRGSVAATRRGANRSANFQRGQRCRRAPAVALRPDHAQWRALRAHHPTSGRARPIARTRSLVESPEDRRRRVRCAQRARQVVSASYRARAGRTERADVVRRAERELARAGCDRTTIRRSHRRAESHRVPQARGRRRTRDRVRERRAVTGAALSGASVEKR